MMLHEIPAIPEGKTAYTHLVGFLINQDTFKIEMNSLTLLELIHGKGRGNKELHDAICTKLDAYYADKDSKAENVKIEIIENGVKKLHIEKVYILSEDEYSKICSNIDFGVPMQKLLDDGLKAFRLAIGDFMERDNPKQEVVDKLTAAIEGAQVRANEIESFIRQETQKVMGVSDKNLNSDLGFYTEFEVRQGGKICVTSMLIARMLHYLNGENNTPDMDVEKLHFTLINLFLMDHALDIQSGALTPFRYKYEGKLLTGFAITPEGVLNISINLLEKSGAPLPLEIMLILAHGFQRALQAYEGILEENSKRQMLEAIKKMTSGGV